MSNALRVLLLLGALIMVWYICKSIRKSKAQMKDTIAWLVIALVLIVFGVFPIVPVWLAVILGIESPANMVFLIFISILILRVFSLSLRVSMLEDKNVSLAAEIAIRTADKKNEKE